MKEVLVSIIIPVYNGSNFLKNAIDSALAQTYKKIEIIVVNDGSNDNGETEKIALSYGDKIRYFKKDNGGVATALNLGIRKMKGEYFSWLSHDDLYYPQKIERQINELYKQENTEAIVYGDFNILNEKNKKITPYVIGEEYYVELLTNSVFPVIQGVLNFCTMLIHKSHFDRVGFFDEKLITTQDYDFGFRLLRNQKTVYIDEPLICSRSHEEQGSKTIDIHQKEREELYIKIMNDLNEEEVKCMFGSNYNFYSRMFSFFKATNMYEAARFASEEFNKCEMPPETLHQIKRFQKYINKLSNEKAKHICIFGTGQWGKRLYHELNSRLINVQYFTDNSKEMWGKKLFNSICISPKRLEEEKEQTLVIVAIKESEVVLQQLRNLKFPYVVTKQQLSSELITVPPIKWLTILENDMDIYTDGEKNTYLVNYFNKVIFDICKFYQNRL